MVPLKSQTMGSKKATITARRKYLGRKTPHCPQAAWRCLNEYRGPQG